MKPRSGGKSGDDDKVNDKRRVARVEQELQRTIAQYLVGGFSDPLPGLVTIAKIIMPGDLRSAKVYVSVIGTDGDRKDAIETLNARAFEIQKYVGDQLRMRYCPKIKFLNDDTSEHVMKIDRILYDLEKEKLKNAANSSASDEDDSE